MNSIPEEAWIEVDARSTSETVLVFLEREVREIAAAAACMENEGRTRDSAPLAVECVRTGQRSGGITPGDAPLVRAALEATRAVGREPVLAAASTDANAAIAAGIPAIAIGGGGTGGDAHSLREWFDDTHSSPGVERALTLVAALATLPA